MISFRLLGNTGALADKIRKLERQIDTFKTEILEESAAFLVLESPVDTGVYMDSHHVGTSAASGSTSSYGKPINQPYQPYADAAISRLTSEINALPEDSKRVVFSNTSEHADEVEYTHGHAPYTKMRSRLPEIVDRAAARAKAT